MEIFSIWSSVPEKYRGPFKKCKDVGGILEFSEQGGYIFFLGVFEPTAEEIHNIANGIIQTRILEPPASTPLVQNVFSSLFMFGNFGPIETFFNPALYEKIKWNKFAQLNRITNRVLFCSMDTKNWIWTSIRGATMPREWSARLSSWWNFLENFSIDREQHLQAINTWKEQIDRKDLLSLWDEGKKTGSFGE